MLPSVVADESVSGRRRSKISVASVGKFSTCWKFDDGKNIRCNSVHVSLATATLISLTLTMPWKTVCSRYEVITDSQVFVGVRCQRLLTNKQREETSRAEPWRHIATSNDLGVTITCEFCPEGYVWRLLITYRLRVPAALQKVLCDGLRF